MGAQKDSSMSTPPPTVAIGEPAPEFDLALVVGDGRARLANYHGRAPFLLVLLRSFECPFCRRNLAVLKGSADQLSERGVETLAVTTTGVKAARLYAKYRPPGLLLASDPTLGIHRAYGVPIYRYTSDGPTEWPRTVNLADLEKLVLKASDVLPEPTLTFEAVTRLNAEDDYEKIEADETGPPDDVSPLISYFLIDRNGIVRWARVIAFDDPADYAQHPSADALLAAVDTLAD